MDTETVFNPLFDITPLIPPLAGGELILTPNQRLSRKIRDAWLQHLSGSGNHHWQAPNVMPLSSWIGDCWLQLVDAAFAPALAGAPANPHQQRWLWQQVIEQIGAGDLSVDDFNAASFTDTAHQAWQLLRQWQLDETQLADSAHPGVRLLCRWGRQWEAQLADRDLISGEQQAIIVLAGFQSRTLPAAPALHLVGFQSLPPLDRALIDSAASAVHTLDFPAADTPSRVWQAPDFNRELAAAANWARTTAAEDPKARIGVVVPDLSPLRRKVELAFGQVFAPEDHAPGSPYHPAPFNISATTPLSETPLVDAALALLELNHREIPLEHGCRLLASPFWGNWNSEGPQRADAIAALRENGLARLPVNTFRQLVADSEEGEDNGLSSRLLALATAQRQLKAKQSFDHWCDGLEAQLSLLGWPGERTLNSLEYQQYEHWLALLDQFRQLDRVAAPVTVEQALRQLRQLAGNTGFQAETPDAQVQILGTLEAAGLRFDHLWILQMDDRHWPAATEPNPLLPASLQRELGMPRACPRRELALSNALFDLLRYNCGNMVASFARFDGDVEYQPSTLIAGLPAADGAGDTLDHPWQAVIAASRQLQIILDARGPALTPRQSPWPGAAGFVAAQAGCPFNAFAGYRLGAQPLGEPVTGLTPLERGNLLHYSLESLWRTLNDQQALVALAPDARAAAIRQAVDNGLGYFRQRNPGRIRFLPERHLALEADRLTLLLASWLDIEAQRQPFRVAHTELSAQLPLPGFPLRLRIDRVDELADGSQVIIDYKTGNPSLASLAGERITEPQLALYALAVDLPLAAVGYAVIQGKTVIFKGMGSNDNGLPGCQPLQDASPAEQWPDVLAHWRQALAAIVAEILAGDASLAFHSREAAQYNGHLAALNRIADQERIARWRAQQQQASS